MGGKAVLELYFISKTPPLTASSAQSELISAKLSFANFVEIKCSYKFLYVSRPKVVSQFSLSSEIKKK